MRQQTGPMTKKVQTESGTETHLPRKLQVLNQVLLAPRHLVYCLRKKHRGRSALSPPCCCRRSNGSHGAQAAQCRALGGSSGYSAPLVTLEWKADKSRLPFESRSQSLWRPRKREAQLWNCNWAWWSHKEERLESLLRKVNSLS